MDIRMETAIIVEKDGRFLAGRSLVTGELIWRNSPYDAWKTRRRDKALIVADKVAGNRMLFNPAAGQLRRLAT